MHVEVEQGRDWSSPALDLEVNDKGDYTLVSGRIGPHPNLWTLFLFLYASFLFLGLASSVVAATLWYLDMPIQGVWLMPVSAAGLVGTWLFGQWGRRRHRDQIQWISALVDDALSGFRKIDLSDEPHDPE